MIRSNIPGTAVAVGLMIVMCAGGTAFQDAVSDANAIEGLWSGAWGGGQRDGVVFQPVKAELLIQGDHVELNGFRNASRLTGTVRVDVRAKRIHITPTPEAGGQPAPKAIEYAYDIKADELTLTDSEKTSISLQRLRVAQNPLANARVELVAATEINKAGDLLVTEFTVLRAGRAGVNYFQPQERSLKTKQATVYVAQETGLKKITVDEARGRIRSSTPVVVAYRPNDRTSPPQFHELWTDLGSPMPDSDAVWQTYARLLRPGTVIFVLSARENIPQP